MQSHAKSGLVEIFVIGRASPFAHDSEVFPVCKNRVKRPSNAQAMTIVHSHCHIKGSHWRKTTLGRQRAALSRDLGLIWNILDSPIRF